MKQLVAIGLLVVLGIWLAFSVARGGVEGVGSQCASNQNCGGGNCLAGAVINKDKCSGSPGALLCQLYQNTQQGIPISYCVCVDSATMKNRCSFQALPAGTNPANCGQMTVWNCGCINGDNDCGYTTCKCSGANDGQANFNAALTCTGC